jgi:hypothetical protein
MHRFRAGNIPTTIGEARFDRFIATPNDLRALRRSLHLRRRRPRRRLLVRRRVLSRADAGGRRRGLSLPGLPARACSANRNGCTAMRPASCLTLALLAAAPAGATAQDNPLLGTWEIVEAQPAPWAEEDRHAALTAAGKRLLNQIITFAPREVIAKNKSLACKRAEYESTSYEADAIFQGNLPEPNPTAAALRLGFKKGENPGVDLKCRSGPYSYHFRDRNTVLTARGNVIYPLKRM